MMVKVGVEYTVYKYYACYWFCFPFLQQGVIVALVAVGFIILLIFLYRQRRKAGKNAEKESLC